MKNPIVVFLILAFLGISNQGYACKCPSQSIDREVDKAHDIVIGKVIAEKNEWVICKFPWGDSEAELKTSYLYTIQTEYSYKGKLKGAQLIQGGKGRGDCGGMFEVGKEYLIVVHKCDKGLFTILCSDNVALSEASKQIKFLNTYFGKDYKLTYWSTNELVAIFSTVAALILVITLLGVYTSRFKRKSLV